jgi:cell fate regulator YaaT (PSP1 superfamily)
MAKRQNLPIVPSKVSGVCGRLMCCLAYEHSQYKQLANNLYRKGTELLLNIGDAIVIDSYILKQTLLVEVKETGDLQEVPLSAIKKVYDTKQNVNKNL